MNRTQPEYPDYVRAYVLWHLGQPVRKRGFLAWIRRYLWD